jgi:uncharacterized hydrophobic protein (TIGR00271 family)
MEQSSLPYFGFYVLLAFAVVISTFGLLANSAAIVIGGMIIAPLMHPIMSLAFSIVVAERILFIRSLLTLVTGVGLVVGVAYLSVEILGLRLVGSEILDRTRPTLLDLGVALAAGGAGAFAYTRRGIFSAIAGVAIAVALVPPLAVAGIGLALGREGSTDSTLSFAEIGLHSGAADVSVGALMLFVTNLTGILIIAAIVFVSNGYGQWKKAVFGILVIAIGAGLLIQPLGLSLRQIYLKSLLLSRVATLIVDDPGMYPGTARLENIDVSYRDGSLYVNLDVLVPEEEIARLGKRVEAIQRYLTEQVGQPVRLRVEAIPIKVVTYEFPLAAVDAGKSTASPLSGPDVDGKPNEETIELRTKAPE